MAQTKNKTQKTEKSVDDFIASIKPQDKQDDSRQILKIMKEISGAKPKMWGSSIIGFGDYHYQYESGREGDWFKIGFSPRKQNLTLYVLPHPDHRSAKLNDLLDKLGKHKTSVSCLYINKLADVDANILELVIKTSYESMNS